MATANEPKAALCGSLGEGVTALQLPEPSTVCASVGACGGERFSWRGIRGARGSRGGSPGIET